VVEGKATIRLKTPARDFCIRKADALQLKAFINIVKAALAAKSAEDIEKLSLTSASYATPGKRDFGYACEFQSSYFNTISLLLNLQEQFANVEYTQIANLFHTIQAMVSYIFYSRCLRLMYVCSDFILYY
jgi:hypothetical protein